MFGLFKKRKKKNVEKTSPDLKNKVKREEVIEEPIIVEEVVEEVTMEEVVVEETVEESKIEETPKSEDTPEETDVEEKPEEDEKEQTEKPKKVRKLPYHITKHADGGWQIKRGKAKKALRKFETQKEAIEFAKVLEKEKGESFIIHKADGTTRKKKY